MKRSELAQQILPILKRTYPDATCALRHHNAWELLIATILSAQCTDVRVNMITPMLFKKYPDARALARAARKDVLTIIRSTGFYRNKAKSIQGASLMIVETFGEEVPQTIAFKIS